MSLKCVVKAVYRVLTLLLSLNSTSGASVVAIDNKIEQAMVKYFLFKSFVFEWGGDPFIYTETLHIFLMIHILCKPVHWLV